MPPWVVATCLGGTLEHPGPLVVLVTKLDVVDQAVQVARLVRELHCNNEDVQQYAASEPQHADQIMPPIAKASSIYGSEENTHIFKPPQQPIQEPVTLQGLHTFILDFPMCSTREFNVKLCSESLFISLPAYFHI